MLLQLAANVTALSSKPHPPPPPPPPPLIPLEGGGLFCNNLSLPIEAKPLIVVFGGSNTAGTNSIALQPNGGVLYGRHIPSFVNLLRSALPQYGQVGHIEGGSGPSLFGACASQFVPLQTRIGIVEFLPNIGYAKEDKAELAAIKLLLQMMHSRGAATYLVNILSGTKRYVRDERSGFCGKFNETMRDKSVIGCMSRARVLYFHEELKKIALATHAHVISRDADETPELFGADSFHINVNGHRSVFNEIWQTHRTQRCKEPSPYKARDVAAAGMGVLCALGSDLEPLVREAVGFRKVDSARVDNAPKVGWEALEPGASLTLCSKLPREDLEEKVQDFRDRVMPNRKDQLIRPLSSVAPYRISLGFQVSHPRNRPLFGVAHVECFGTCNCTCDSAVSGCAGNRMDTLQNTSLVTITTFMKLLAWQQTLPLPMETKSSCPADSCIIRVHNQDDSAGTRFKVVVRALILGLNDWRMRGVERRVDS